MSEQTMNRFRRNMPTEQDQMNVQNGLDEVTNSFGSNNPPPTSLEKSFDSVSPEELFEVEQEAVNKAIGDYPTMITTKLEEEERHLEELRRQLEEGSGEGAATTGGAGGAPGGRTVGGGSSTSQSGGGRAPSGPSGAGGQTAGSRGGSSQDVETATNIARNTAPVGNPDSVLQNTQNARATAPIGNVDAAVTNAAQDIAYRPTPPSPVNPTFDINAPPTQGAPTFSTAGLHYTFGWNATTGQYEMEVSVTNPYGSQYYGHIPLAPDYSTAWNNYQDYTGALTNALNTPETPNSQNAQTVNTINQAAYNNYIQDMTFGSGAAPAQNEPYNAFTSNPTKQPTISIQQTPNSPNSYDVFAAGGANTVGTITVNGNTATFSPKPGFNIAEFSTTATSTQDAMQQMLGSPQFNTEVSETQVTQGGGNVTPPSGQTPSATQSPVATPDELAAATTEPTAPQATVSPPATSPTQTTPTPSRDTTPTATPQELAQAISSPVGPSGPVRAIQQPVGPSGTPTAPQAPAATPATPTPTAPTRDRANTRREDIRMEELRAFRQEQEEAGAGGISGGGGVSMMEEAGAGGGHAAGRGQTHGSDEPIAYGEGGTQPSIPIPMMRREEEEGPQIPGAASQPRKPPTGMPGQPPQPQPAAPTQPKNPFQNYQPPQQNTQPVSGLPYKPPGGGMKHVHRNRHKSLFDDFFRS